MESEPRDPLDDFDATHGHTTESDEQKPSGLSEGSNKPAPHAIPFKITHQE